MNGWSIRLYREIKGKRRGFKNFVSYLVKHYLSESSKFPFKNWNYFDSITSDQDTAITTNSLENLNGRLKKHVGTGYISQTNAFRKLKTFHEEQIASYTTNICQNRMPKIKPQTLKREQKLLEHISKFSKLPKTDQIANIEYFSIEMGCYASNLDAKFFEKVPPPCPLDIQDSIFNESCLSLSEILSN